MKIVDLNEERLRRDGGGTFQYGDYMFTIAVYAPEDGNPTAQHSGNITDADPAHADMSADGLRQKAEALENLAWILREQAHFMEPNDRGRVLSRAVVYESGEIISWTSDQVVTPEQREWIADCWDDLKESVTAP